MDKEQATKHIITRLQAGYQAEEITEELSRLVKVSPEKVRPFVDQVAASHPEVFAAFQTASVGKSADGQEPVEISRAVEQPAPPTANIDAAGFSDLPPGLRTVIREAQTKGIEPAKPAPVSTPRESPEMSLPRQAEFVPPSEKKEASDIDLESLSAFALQQLKKQRRHNDIVEAVCRKTGWHWNKSQRFVAQVQTKHHDELQSGKNRMTMIVGTGIILAGVIVMLNGASALSDYAKIAVFAKTNPEALLNVSPSAILFALSATVTGIGMIVGGGYGIARALTNR
jgi:hypothetical protein